MESSKLYVGNLKYSVTDEQLAQLFAQFGEVKSANVIKGKGFGFVEMANAEAAQAAISALHGVSVDGRTIVVNLARPREDSRGAGGDGAQGYRSSTRSDVGYGNGGYGGGRY